MKRISNLQSNTCGFVIHLPRHLLLWDTSKPPSNIFWRCLGIGILALDPLASKSCEVFRVLIFYGSIHFILLHPLPFCALLWLERDPHRPHAPAGHEPSWNIKFVGIALLPIMGCSSICNQRRHTVSSAEPQNSGVWLMFQPHPLDQRHNYIVINFAGSLDLPGCERLWLLFIKYHLPEEWECNRAAICGVQDVLRVELSINLCIGLNRRLNFGTAL